VVDGSGLENRRARKGTGGSNPSLSAIAFMAKVCRQTTKATLIFPVGFHDYAGSCSSVRQFLFLCRTRYSKFVPLTAEARAAALCTFPSLPDESPPPHGCL
jgi:hypothetical protein